MAVKRLLQALVVSALVVPLSAFAADLQETLDEARVRLKDGDAKSTIKLLKALRSELDEEDALVTRQAMSQLFFYEGVAWNQRGKSKDMDAWRAALVVDEGDVRRMDMIHLDSVWGLRRGKHPNSKGFSYPSR